MYMEVIHRDAAEVIHRDAAEVIHRDAAAGCPAILTAENSRPHQPRRVRGPRRPRTTKRATQSETRAPSSPRLWLLASIANL